MIDLMKEFEKEIKKEKIERERKEY